MFADGQFADGNARFGRFVNFAVVQLDFIPGDLAGIVLGRRPAECAFVLAGDTRIFQRSDFRRRGDVFNGALQKNVQRRVPGWTCC